MKGLWKAPLLVLTLLLAQLVVGAISTHAGCVDTYNCNDYGSSSYSSGSPGSSPSSYGSGATAYSSGSYSSGSASYRPYAYSYDRSYANPYAYKDYHSYRYYSYYRGYMRGYRAGFYAGRYYRRYGYDRRLSYYGCGYC